MTGNEVNALIQSSVSVMVWHLNDGERERR